MNNNIFEFYEEVIERQFQVPGCESMIKDIDVSGLLDELEQVKDSMKVVDFFASDNKEKCNSMILNETLNNP